MTLLLLACGWIAGTYLAVAYDTSIVPLLLFLSASILLVPLLTNWRVPVPPLLPLVVVLAMIRVVLPGGGDGLALDGYHNRGPVQVDGMVVDDPEANGTTSRLRLRVYRVAVGDIWADESEDVLVTLAAPQELAQYRDPPFFRYGDRLLLSGQLEPPPELEEFDYPGYLARQGIGSIMSFPQVTLVDDRGGSAFRRWLYDARRGLAGSLEKTLPEPHAAVGQALLLGLRDGLDSDVVDTFRATGTSHVLAISGLHVGIVLSMGLSLAAWVIGRRRHLYLLAPLVLIWAYALLAGMSPSVTRAAIMGTVYLVALLLGRPRSALPALGLAAALMVALDPTILWMISFQLSFTAVTGIVLFADPILNHTRTALERRLQPDGVVLRIASSIAYPVAVGTAATIATLPLVAFHFREVSLVGVPTTVVLLPALPFVLVTQAVTAMTGLVSAPLAEAVGWTAWAGTGYVVGVVNVVGKLPGQPVETGPLAPVLVWLYYGILCVLLVRGPVSTSVQSWMRQPIEVDLSAGRVAMAVISTQWLLVVIAASAAALLWFVALSPRDPEMRVSFLDVGQGDSIFISTPASQQVLIDGGPDPRGIARLLGGIMPPGDRTIELVVLTHPHSDHLTGLVEVLDRYRVEHILQRRVEYETALYETWHRAVEREGAVATEAVAGQLIPLGDGAYLEVISPDERMLVGAAGDVNNASVALRLVHGGVSFFLSGDISSEVEAVLVSRSASVASDVLKVAHHGSRTSSRPDFLEAVSPAVAVISVAADNRFGHPHPDVLASLEEQVAPEIVYMTRDRGTIDFTTDGRRLWVRTER